MMYIGLGILYLMAIISFAAIYQIRDENESKWAVIIPAFILIFASHLIGVLFSYNTFQSPSYREGKLMEEAVEAGVAEYVVIDNKGKTEFRFKSPASIYTDYTRDYKLTDNK